MVTQCDLSARGEQQRKQRVAPALEPTSDDRSESLLGRRWSREPGERAAEAKATSEGDGEGEATQDGTED